MCKNFLGHLVITLFMHYFNRENVAEMLNGIPNGSFLVIDSAEVEGEYILMLRLGHAHVSP